MVTVQKKSFTSDFKPGVSSDMTTCLRNHMAISEKCAKPVLQDAYLEILELWNDRQCINKLLDNGIFSIWKHCLARGTVPGYFLQYVRNQKEPPKTTEPPLWTTGLQPHKELLSDYVECSNGCVHLQMDILSSHTEFTYGWTNYHAFKFKIQRLFSLFGEDENRSSCNTLCIKEVFHRGANQ